MALGVGALVVAAVAMLAATSANAARRRGAVTPVLTVAQLPGHTGPVIVAGVIDAGPDGVLRAPLTNTPCVWYSATTVERWYELDRAFVRDLDGDGRLDRSEVEAARRERHHVETDTDSVPFVLRDDTGSVPVQASAVRPDRLPRHAGGSGSLNQGGMPDDVLPLHRAGYGPGLAAARGPVRRDVEETAVRLGDRVTLLAEAVRSGGRAVLTGDPVVVSGRMPEEMQTAGAWSARLAWAVAVVAVVVATVALVRG